MLWCDVGDCVFRQATMCQDVAAECLEPQNIVGRTAPSRNVAADCLGPQKLSLGSLWPDEFPVSVVFSPVVKCQ